MARSWAARGRRFYVRALPINAAATSAALAAPTPGWPGGVLSSPSQPAPPTRGD